MTNLEKYNQAFVEALEISEDQLTYSFELLPDVKFHDGTTLTSADVKYSYERLVKLTKMATLLENVEGYQELADGTADELSGVVIQDDTHFTITLTKPYAPFLSVLSTAYTAIYPHEACEAAGENWGMTTLYGTGPFKMDSYQTGVGVTLTRFDDYHGGAVKLDGVDYKFIEDVNTALYDERLREFFESVVFEGGNLGKFVTAVELVIVGYVQGNYGIASAFQNVARHSSRNNGNFVFVRSSAEYDGYILAHKKITSAKF